MGAERKGRGAVCAWQTDLQWPPTCLLLPPYRCAKRLATVGRNALSLQLPAMASSGKSSEELARSRGVAGNTGLAQQAMKASRACGQAAHVKSLG